VVDDNNLTIFHVVTLWENYHTLVIDLPWWIIIVELWFTFLKTTHGCRIRVEWYFCEVLLLFVYGYLSFFIIFSQLNYLVIFKSKKN
jgi:hypothetical protein